MVKLEKAKGFLAEFKAFALKGNVIDLAVAVVIGAAFNKIVSSFVDCIISPIIGFLTSGINLNDLACELGKNAEGAPLVVLKYGQLVQSAIDFVIIAFSIFVALKVLLGMRRKEEEAPAEPAPKTDEVVLLEEIRDLLKQQADK